MSSKARFKPSTISLATAYDDQSGSGELVIPETFDGMEYEALTDLYANAVEAFNELYEAVAEDMSVEDETQLAALTEGIEKLAAEISVRDSERAERAERAAELASRVNQLSSDETEELAAETDDPEDSVEEEETEEVEEDDENETSDDSAAETVTASAAVRVPLSSIKRKPLKANPVVEESKNKIIYATGSGLGVGVGEGLDIEGVARGINNKLIGFNNSQYANAAKSGRHIREQHNIAAIRRDFPKELTIDSTDRNHVESVLNYAVNEKRLPGGGLVAAGGWCAPSETRYDMLELETRSGLLSLPEVGITRGGISFTPGPSFGDLYSDITGFSFTEEDDIDGNYQPGESGNVTGPKPCYHIECPPFEEARLEVDGLCITAGLLQARGYPEVIARTVRGALVAHDHRVNGLIMARMEAGSTSVVLPSDQAGATAPILTAIEMQAIHYRATHRLDENATLEGVIPFWVRGVIRADLARRQGVDLIDVPNARIDAWFRERGIAPQYVYNWQAIDTTDPANFTQYPDSVKFMLYAAGTWVRGSSDVITLDTVYDSTLLAQNDYTALFTEEGWLVAKRGHDSRVVTVPICADGATNQGVSIECDGTVTEADGE